MRNIGVSTWVEAMRKLVITLAVFGLTAVGLFACAAHPEKSDESALPRHSANLDNGHVLFNAGGCISCHKPPADQAGADPALPSGGAPLDTPVGTVYPPNITPDRATGIGSWSDVQFVNAVKHGVSPDGDNYIPAFPYTSFARMSMEDILDLKAYLMSLKPVASPHREPDVTMLWLVRHSIGVWKRLAMPSAEEIDQPTATDPSKSDSWNRGAYLVNGPGHCGECHTPRNWLEITDQSKYLQGGLHPNGHTKVPSLHNLIGRGLFKDADDLAEGLKEGEGGGYDNMSAGGMSEVQSNIAKLPDADVKAIADYLASLK
jgi:mono/diheme cytochrome c family protein